MFELQNQRLFYLNLPFDVRIVSKEVIQFSGIRCNVSKHFEKILDGLYPSKEANEKTDLTRVVC